MAGVVEDKRSKEEKKRTKGFVVATDKAMSGWGRAPGKSYFAVPFVDAEQAQIVFTNMEARSEMLRVRVVGADYRPRMRDGDHLSIRSMKDCDRFYTPGGFKDL